MTTKSSTAELVGSERVVAAVADLYSALREAALKEVQEFEGMTEDEMKMLTRSAAGRSLDRGLMLIARRVKGEA